MREDSNMNSNIEHNCDVLVIGSGAAGLSLALCLASKAKVIVLSKSGLSAGSTNYAQGGIAGVFNTADDNDSVEEHIEDTKIAGGGLCDPDAVEFTLRNAHDSIEWLIQQGVPFDQKEEAVSEDQSPYHLHREGGHSHRRIFHAADHTGHTIQETLNTRSLFWITIMRLTSLRPESWISPETVLSELTSSTLKPTRLKR